MKKTLSTSFINFLILFIYFLVFLAFSDKAFAQSVPKVLKEDNKEIRKIAKRVDADKWIYFRKNISQSPSEIINKNKGAFGLSNSDEMVLKKVRPMEQGLVRYQFNQYFKGVRIEGATFSVYAVADSSEAGKAVPVKGYGNIVENLDLQASPQVSESKALKAALSAVNARLYAWQDTASENRLKRDAENVNATHFPKAELVITKVSAQVEVYLLAYRFDILALEPFANEVVYVEAQTGKVLRKFSRNKHAGGKVETRYDGVKDFTTYYQRGFPSGKYLLRDPSRSMQTRIHSGSSDPYTSWEEAPGLEDSDNSWTSLYERDATTLLWALERSYDYFKARFSRSGPDNNNREVRGLSNFTGGGAFWTTSPSLHYDMVVVSDSPNNGASFAALDVIGHEYSHGVLYYEAGFNGDPAYPESGALDEGFADIFGFMVSKYENNVEDWQIAEQVNDPLYIRRLDYPHLSGMPQPDTYQGTYWNYEGGSPHINAGVLAKWYYLLSVGGTHNGVTVKGIGSDVAARVAYYTVRDYLQSTDGYKEARAASIQSALYLYGECSDVVKSVTDAWAAVGLGSPAPAACISEIEASTDLLCAEDGPYGGVSYWVSSYGGTVQWEFPSDWVVSTTSGNEVYVYSYPDYATSGYITATLFDGSQYQNKYYYYYIDFCNSYRKVMPQIKVMAQIEEVEALSAATVKLYPNPAEDQLTVELPLSPGAISLELLDMQGRKVVSRSGIKARIITLDVKSLARGMYILRVYNQDGVIAKKVQIGK